MIKKILIISSVIFSLLLVFFGVKKFFLDKKNNNGEEIIVSNGDSKGFDSNESNKSEDGVFGNNGKVQTILTGKIFSPAIKKGTGQIIYYQDQKVLTTDLNGKTKNSLGGYLFNDVKSVLWSDDKKEAIVQDGKEFFIYFLDTDSVEKIKKGADTVVWSGDGNLFYKYFNGVNGVRSLNFSQKDGSNWRAVVPKLTIEYKETALNTQPSIAKNCFFPFPDGKNQGNLKCIDLSGEVRVVHDGNAGADYLWSPDGQKLLTSSVQTIGGNRMLLGVMNDQGGQYQGLDFPTTVKKCTWSKNSKDVYCAMLGPAPEQAILPNDWWSGKFALSDLSFWRIDTETAKKTKILGAKEMSEAVDARNLFLDEQEEFLFFQKGENDGLYRIELK